MRDYTHGFEDLTDLSLEEGVIQDFKDWYSDKKSAINKWMDEHPITTSISKKVIFATLVVIFTLIFASRGKKTKERLYRRAQGNTLFDDLGIDPTDDPKEVEKAYKKTAKEAQKENDKEKFDRAAAAYALLKKLI